MNKNLSLFIHGANDIRLEDAPIPELKPGEVKVAIHCTAICGSDIWVYNKGRKWHQKPTATTIPSIPGHEGSGTVVELGDGVTQLEIGDRVCIEPGVPCRKCHFCIEGRYHLCRSCKMFSDPPLAGFFTRYVCVHYQNVFKLPDNMSFEEEALMEPLAVAVHAVKRANVNVDSRILIVGGGAICLLVMLTAKAYGAHDICVTDIFEERLRVAETLGAKYTTMSTSSVDETVNNISGLMSSPPDVTFECTGVESANKVATHATDNGGQVILIGLGQAEISVPLLQVPMREVDIKGCHRYCNDFPTAIALVSTGKVNLKPLITHHMPIEKGKEAFDMVRSRSDGAIKVILHSAESKLGQGNPTPHANGTQA